MTRPNREQAIEDVLEIARADPSTWLTVGTAERIVDALAAPVVGGGLGGVETRDALLLGLGVTYDGKPLDPAKVELHYRKGSAPSDDRVREALKDAIELAEEGWAYAGDYFVKKWDFEARIAALRAALSADEEAKT